MRMDPSELKQNVVVRGPVLPEPIQIVAVNPIGASVQIMGKGLSTGQFHDPILSPDQIATLVSNPEKEPFDGDPKHFRLGVEALRLA